MNRKELELEVLGTIIADSWLDSEITGGQAFDWAVAKLTENDFLVSEHKEIFAFLLELHEKGKDRTEIAWAVKKKFESYSLLLIEFSLYSFKQFVVKARELIRDTIARERARIGQELAEGKITEKEAMELLSEVNKRLEDEDKTPLEGILEVVEELSDESKKGIYTGFSVLDGYIRFRPGEVSIIGARPSVGKTATAITMSYHQLKDGHKVLFFSMELPAKELMLRYLSYITDWSLRDIKNRKIPLDVLSTEADNLVNLPLVIYDNPNLTLPMIRAKVQQHRPDIVYIDYFQRIIDHKPNRKRLEFLNQASIELTNIAKEFQIPVVVLAQLNRGVRAGKDLPTMENLKDTGHLEQDATNIVLLHRDFQNDPYSMQFIIAKCREGAFSKDKLVVPFVNGFPQVDLSKKEPEPVPYGDSSTFGEEEVDELFDF